MEIFGYAFKDDALLAEALTTPAYRMERPDVKDNQRLEFLGDAVLGLLAADELFAQCPTEMEGSLSVRRAHMVSASALCAVANRLDLVPRLKRNRGASSLPKNSKTIADAVEAIIGAAWLDGGMAAARQIYATLSLSAQASADEWSGNPKGELQVRVQALVPPRHPAYELVRTAGKPHDPIFTVKVSVEGVGEAVAQARSHREAESAAAAKLLRQMTNDRAAKGGR